MKLAIFSLVILSSAFAQAMPQQPNNCAKYVEDVVVKAAGGSVGANATMMQALPGNDENSDHTYDVTVSLEHTYKHMNEVVTSSSVETYKAVVSGNQNKCTLLSLTRFVKNF